MNTNNSTYMKQKYYFLLGLLLFIASLSILLILNMLNLPVAQLDYWLIFSPVIICLARGVYSQMEIYNTPVDKDMTYSRINTAILGLGILWLGPINSYIENYQILNLYGIPALIIAIFFFTATCVPSGKKGNRGYSSASYC